MIDFSKIVSSAQKKAISVMTSEPVIKDVKETSENYDKAQIEFVVSLLEEYHKELKAELQKSGINLD